MKFEAIARACALAVVLAGSLSACSSKNEKAFVGGCVSMGASRENCSCAYEKVDAAHKIDGIDFGEILGTERHRRIQIAFADAVIQCIKENGL
ncbi:hypothetical protein [Acidovorax sp. ACV01]|uniref:hypothetical protein n=1 Tax=Acidovorax sp. ACV01 TaxID=2769311 RepID=UPI00178383C0|nr:hypothetical protein [Acidovorax sp. ACV01]MBD9395292.1 hypothetical protein [Acidovorax sp. ACV01]